jgi:hypothetical protein
MRKYPNPVSVSRRIAGAAAAALCTTTTFCSVLALFQAAGSERRPPGHTIEALRSRCAGSHDVSPGRACANAVVARPAAGKVAER